MDKAKQAPTPRPFFSRLFRRAAAMALPLRSPSSIRRQDLGPHDHDSPPPEESPPPNSLGGSSNGAKADLSKKTKEETNEEVDRVLAKLEKEGVKIDGRTASIIADGIARIKAEAARKNIRRQPKWNWVSVLDAVACIAAGFMMGIKWYGHALRAANGHKRRCAFDEELAKSQRA